MEEKKLLALFGSVCLILVLAVLPFMAACPAPPAEEEEAPPAEEEVPPPVPELPKELVWGSRATGDYNIQAVGFIKVTDKYMPTTVIFREAANVASAVTMMQKGELDVYGAALRDLGLAYRGTGELKDLGKSDIRLILAGRSSPIAFFTVPRTGVTRIEDLAGLRVSYTSARALVFNEVGAAILEYYGLLDKIVSIPNVPKEEKKAGLIEGTLDVSLEGVLSGNPLEWKSTVGVVVLGLSKECAEYVYQKCPYTEPVTLPAGFGDVIDREIVTVATLGGVICRTDLSDNTVYEILKAIYEHYDELLPIHSVFEDTVLERAASLSATVPYHPGAVKYYKEKGVWSSEMDALQKKLLAE